MASYRIADSDVVDIGGVHSGLADRGPMLESGVDDSSLGEYLAKCIVVKNGGLERSPTFAQCMGVCLSPYMETEPMNTK